MRPAPREQWSNRRHGSNRNRRHRPERPAGRNRCNRSYRRNRRDRHAGRDRPRDRRARPVSQVRRRVAIGSRVARRPAGVTGATGSTGPSGPAGAGASARRLGGPDGPSGPRGATGATGAQRPERPSGPAPGPTGPSGPSGPAGTGSSGPSGPTFTQWRSGTGTIAATTSTVTITMSSAFTGSPTNYRVALDFTNSPDLGVLNTGWGYLAVEGKTATTFTVTRYATETGAATAVPEAITFDWVALPNQ